jgi:hypothetical protein
MWLKRCTTTTASPRRLADEFHGELRMMIECAAANPLRFHLVDRDFRRINLPRFPYHILYDVRPDAIRLMIVRHNKRHPNYGMERK